MAIVVVHSSNAIEGVTVSSVASSPTFTSTAGNLLIAGCVGDSASAEGTTPLSNVGADTWTGNKQSNVGSDPAFLNIGFAKNINGHASEAVTYSLNAAQYPSCVLIEVSGCDTTSPNDVAPSYVSATGTNISNTNLNSSMITPPAGNHLLVVVASANDGGTSLLQIADAGTGAATWTTIKNDSTSGMPLLVATAIVTADGSHTYGGQIQFGAGSNGNTAMIGIAAFKAAGAAAVIPPGLGPVVQMDQMFHLDSALMR